MNNRDRLITLITDYGLDRREVAELVRAKRDAVDHWLLPVDSKNHEEVPEMAIELLELKLGAKQLGLRQKKDASKK
jgi:hypothetical protein